MRRFFKRPDKLEVRLWDRRPQPKDELVERITNETSAHRRTIFRPALRPQFAVGFTVVALGAAVALGGLGLGGTAGDGVDTFAAKQQYGNKVTICHRPPGNPGNAHTIRVGEPAAQAHMRNHGDTRGPCPQPRPGKR